MAKSCAGNRRVSARMVVSKMSPQEAALARLAVAGLRVAEADLRLGGRGIGLAANLIELKRAANAYRAFLP